MGLISSLVTWPLKPVHAAVWIAEQLKRSAEQEYYDPAVVRDQLTKVERAHADGEISDQERDELQKALLNRLLEAQHRSGKT